MHDIYAQNMDMIEETGSINSPTFIIDDFDSSHNESDVNHDANNNFDDSSSVKSVKMNNNIIRNDIKQGNFDSPLIKYLLEPPSDSRRSKNGSVCSSISGI